MGLGFPTHILLNPFFFLFSFLNTPNKLGFVSLTHVDRHFEFLPLPSS